MKKTQHLAPIGMGLYHSGIEFNGLEYCYGGDLTNPGHGVMQMGPCNIAGAVYHQSYLMGVVHDTKFLYNTLEETKQQFKAREYSLVSQNCNHFSDALCQRLVNRRIPAYVNRLARLGSWIKFILPQSVKSLNPIPSDPTTSHQYLSESFD